MSTDNKETAAGDAITTPTQNTYAEGKVTTTGRYLLYYPEKNGFIALYPEEWDECRADAYENTKVIEALQAANGKATEAAIASREAQRTDVVKDMKKADADLSATLVDVAEKSKAAKKRI